METKSEQHILIPLFDDEASNKMVVTLCERFANTTPDTFRLFFFRTAIDYLYIPNWIKRQLVLLRIKGPSLQKKLLLQFGFQTKQLVFSNLFFAFKKRRRKMFRSKEELLSLQVNGIVIGDLVYDTYLRFKAKPTVDINDPALYDLINYSEQLFRKTEVFLSHNKFKAVVLPYTTYTHWGIMARIAVSKKLPVYTFGRTNYFLQELTAVYAYHSKNHSLFPQLFAEMKSNSSLPAYMAIAKNALEQRLKGVIDSSISYMRSSAYGVNNSDTFEIKENSLFAVIFAHCFFDSPHIYGDMLFTDFYEWMDFLLIEAEKNNHVHFYIKEHPNGLPGNKEILKELLERRHAQNISILPSTTSNAEIIQKKPAAIFSVYGTVCHEFAYCGVPVIMAGENPHSAYEFFYAPDSIAKLGWYIQNLGSYHLPEKFSQEDIVEFFFMNYMYFNKEIINKELTPWKNFENGMVSLDKIDSRAGIVYPG